MLLARVLFLSLLLPRGVRGHELDSRGLAREHRLKRKAEQLLHDLEQAADVPALVAQPRTQCSCYVVRNDICCMQRLCICSPICWNGRELISIGQPECLEAQEMVPGNAVLEPQACSPDAPFRASLALSAGPTASVFHPGGSLVERPGADAGPGPNISASGAWLASRSRVEWRLGTSFLATMDRTTANIAHFAGRAFTLLLANNRTDPALSRPVHRVMVPRSDATVERWRLLGWQSFPVMLLQTLLEFALVPVLGPELHSSRDIMDHRVVGDRGMAFGLVEFEGPWEAATEEEPLCFQSAVMASPLAGQAYPAGQAQARAVQDHLRGKLMVHRPEAPLAGSRVRLLYVTRLGRELHGRRAFLTQSHEALLGLLHSLNFEVALMEPRGVPFPEQLAAFQRAEVVVSLHGAALVNPPVLSPGGTVVLEFMPHHTFHETYYAMAVNSGLPYMMKRCGRGAPRDGDTSEMEALTDFECLHGHPRCKEHYTHRRAVELTPTDLEETRKLLEVAAAVVSEARAFGDGSSQIGERLSREKRRVWAVGAGREHACIRGVLDPKCKEDFLRVKSREGDYVCVLSSDCYSPTAAVAAAPL